MHSLLALDKVQLDRIDHAIAALQALPPGERSRKANLINALECERKELVRCNPAIRQLPQLQAA